MAVTCFLITIVAGLALTNYIAPEYYNSWSLTYGQSLLVKHLLIVPLLIFGVINGFLMKRRVRSENGCNPISWTRAESVFVLMIFSATGFMSLQEPPHDVAQTLKMADPSALFLQLYQGVLSKDPDLTLIWTPMSLSLSIAAFLFGALMVVTFRKRISPFLGVFMGVMIVLSGYLSIMHAVA